MLLHIYIHKAIVNQPLLKRKQEERTSLKRCQGIAITSFCVWGFKTKESATLIRKKSRALQNFPYFFFSLLQHYLGISCFIYNVTAYLDDEEEANADFVCLGLSFMYKPCNNNTLLAQCLRKFSDLLPMNNMISLATVHVSVTIA